MTFNKKAEAEAKAKEIFQDKHVTANMILFRRYATNLSNKIPKIKSQISTDPPAGGELMNTFKN